MFSSGLICFLWGMGLLAAGNHWNHALSFLILLEWPAISSVCAVYLTGSSSLLYLTLLTLLVLESVIIYAALCSVSRTSSVQQSMLVYHCRYGSMMRWV